MMSPLPEEGWQPMAESGADGRSAISSGPSDVLVGRLAFPADLVGPRTGRVLGGFAALQGSRRDPLVRFSIRTPNLAAASIRDHRTRAKTLTVIGTAAACSEAGASSPLTGR